MGFKERLKEIQEACRVAILHKMKDAEEATARRLKKKEDLTSNIIDWGLWQSVESVDASLAVLKTKTEKVSAL